MQNADAYRPEATNNVYIGGGKRCWGYQGEDYVYEPIDLCACYEPMIDAPADFVEERYTEHGLKPPVSCKVTRKIGNTWYIIETECNGDEPLPSIMRRLIFSDKEAI